MKEGVHVSRIIQLLLLHLPRNGVSHVFLGSLHTSYLATYLEGIPQELGNKLTLLEAVTVAPGVRQLIGDGEFSSSRCVQQLFSGQELVDLGVSALRLDEQDEVRCGESGDDYLSSEAPPSPDSRRTFSSSPSSAWPIPQQSQPASSAKQQYLPQLGKAAPAVPAEQKKAKKGKVDNRPPGRKVLPDLFPPPYRIPEGAFNPPNLEACAIGDVQEVQRWLKVIVEGKVSRSLQAYVSLLLLEVSASHAS
ncbi:hypothetical protein JCM8547_006843 [Rhodosporidiobolus lusitaniae]